MMEMLKPVVLTCTLSVKAAPTFSFDKTVLFLSSKETIVITATKGDFTSLSLYGDDKNTAL